MSQPPSPLGEALDAMIDCKKIMFSYKALRIKGCFYHLLAKLRIIEMTKKNINFKFLPNGKPLASLKNEAHKIFKSSEAKSLSMAKNLLSNKLFNKSYNKMVKDLEISSPQVIEGILYMPIKINLSNYDKEGYFYYFVAVNDKKISLNLNVDLKLDLKADLIDDLSLLSFDKVETKCSNGWIIKSPLNNLIIELRTTERGIMASLHDMSSNNVLETKEVCYHDIYSPLGYHELLNNKKVSDYEASTFLNHDNDNDTTVMLIIGGVHFCLFSSWVIEKEGSIFTIPYILKELKSKNIDLKDLYKWFDGEYNENFENWYVPVNPYFSLATESGGVLSEVFSEIPKTLSERSLFAAKSLM